MNISHFNSATMLVCYASMKTIENIDCLNSYCVASLLRALKERFQKEMGNSSVISWHHYGFSQVLLLFPLRIIVFSRMKPSVMFS